MQQNQPLSNLQLALLKVFSRQVPDEDLSAIKQLLANYFAQKAVALADDAWEQEGLSEVTMQEWRQMHLRTPYNPDPKSKAHS